MSVVEFMRQASEVKSLEELEKLAEESKKLVEADPTRAPLLATLFSYLRLRFRLDDLEKRVKALEAKQ